MLIVFSKFSYFSRLQN